MKLEKSRRKIIKEIIIILLILLLIVIGLIIYEELAQKRTPKENLSYINSDDLDDLDKKTFSPDLIHLITLTYEGDLPAVSISKSTYYFTTELVPEYLKKCDTDENTEEYYAENSESVRLNLGIENIEDFKNIVNIVRNLSGRLKYESSTFERESIVKDTDGVSANLIIKYKNNDEIKFNVYIRNNVYTNESSIVYSSI